VNPGRVLVVEDDPDVRGVCVDILDGLGYAVTAVEDGALALQEIARFQPDVILLDLIMPRAQLDGLGLLTRLAAAPVSIPVIVLSAFGDALTEGVSPAVTGSLRIEAVLPKPVSVHILAREIDRLVGPGANGPPA
jgi:two-component system response regulator MprA